MRTIKCERCGQQPATYEVQYDAAGAPVAYVLGRQRRGANTLKVCEECRIDLNREWVDEELAAYAARRAARNTRAA